MQIPRLQLTLGQVAWALNFGQPAPQHLLDQLNYLRQLGVPFAREERPSGSGNRVRYGYNEMIECGVAIYALHNGMKPADISKVVVGQRSQLRKLYRKALHDQPELALTASWVKSRGREGALRTNDIWLRLHDRYSQTPGAMETVDPSSPDAPAGVSLFDPVERYAGGPTLRLVPLTGLALQWTAWALEAPEIRVGRPS